MLGKHKKIEVILFNNMIQQPKVKKCDTKGICLFSQ